jgi:hypothetical protein
MLVASIAVLLILGVPAVSPAASAAPRHRRHSTVASHRPHPTPASEGSKSNETQSADVGAAEAHRLVIPDSPQDGEAPIPDRHRPSFVTIWLGDKSVPPARADTPTQPAPTLTLYAEDVGAFYRKLRKQLFD